MPWSHRATEKREGETRRGGDKETRCFSPCLLVSLSPRLLVFLSLSLLLSVSVARADELHLIDGRVIEAEEVWEIADSIWYRQGKIIASFAKTEVLRITKPKLALSTSPSTPSVSSDSSAPSRKISRVILKGGTQIDADAVWESADRVGYRLGKMQAFIDRSDVERVVREVAITEREEPSSN